MSAPSALRSACPVAASLDLFGDRWTLLILRDLLLDGRTRFSEFAAQEGVATNILSDRLQRLLEAGLIVRNRDPEDGRRWIYAPTQPAIDLIPALLELVLWGNRHTEGAAPAWVLDAAAVDKPALIAQITARAVERAAL